MRDHHKVLGVIFIVTGLLNLLLPDSPDFGIFTAAGVGLLFNAG